MGLQQAGLSLSLNGGTPQSIPVATTTATLGTVPSGSSYGVTIVSQPTGQSCYLMSDTGIVAGTDITVFVTCNNMPLFVTGSVSGLSGSGLTLTMTGSVNQTVSIPSGATTYQFPTALYVGDTYNVAVLTQPVGQTCTVTNGSGVVAGANITGIIVSCSTDATPPAPVTELSGIAISTSQIAISWSAPTDNLTLPGKLIYKICYDSVVGGCASSVVTSPGVTSGSLTGLIHNTTYSISVSAIDEAGNMGSPATLSITTPMELCVIGTGKIDNCKLN